MHLMDDQGFGLESLQGLAQGTRLTPSCSASASCRIGAPGFNCPVVIARRSSPSTNCWAVGGRRLCTGLFIAESLLGDGGGSRRARSS
ncbi:hypothetical protein ACR6C2_04685 [Streptomyces sp. INA 01156]